ncbi:MAG: hypothetical protein FJY19_01120 [Bacteroidetes bacterium]|nr:hypothetical protein [Bacteroidota bacterium]
MLDRQNSYSTKAINYTALVVLLFILLLFLFKWKLPSFEKDAPINGVDVEVNWPPDPPAPFQDGGGGGGQALASPEQPGLAQPNSQDPGEQQLSKEVETDPLSTQTAVTHNRKKNKNAKSLTSNSPKTKSKPNIEPPSPPQAKAVMGKSNQKTGAGGNEAIDFERSGGAGNGWGTGKGNGAGGGAGEGSGGGSGTGIGAGNGPRVTRGDRKIVRSYAFEGELNKATLYVNIAVSPDGTGRFVNFAKGSTATGSTYRQAIVQYLEKIRFDVSDHESLVTVQFNFRIN